MKHKKNTFAFLLALVVLAGTAPGMGSGGYALEQGEETQASMQLGLWPEEADEAIADETEPPEDETREKLTEEELEAVVTSQTSYEELSTDVQQQIQSDYRIRESVLEDCQQAGYSLEESVELGKILQMAGLTTEEFAQMVQNHDGDQEAAKEQAKIFGNFQYCYDEALVSKNPVCIQYLINGYDAYNILKAAAMAWMLETEITRVSALDQEQNMDEDDPFSVIAALYHVQRDVLEAAAASRNMTGEEFSDWVYEQIGGLAHIETGGISPMSAGGTNGGFDPEKYPTAPFTYNQKGTEILNQQTGSVGYRETEAVIPGANGLDLSIGVQYNLADSTESEITAFTSGIETKRTANKSLTKKMHSPLVYFAAGWNFNFSYIKYFENGFEPAYPGLVTSDGMNFPLSLYDIKNTDTEEIRNANWWCHVKELRVYKDTSYVADDVTSKFSVQYKDGRKEYFDNQGKLMKTENRFGDKITYKYTVTGTEYAHRFQEYNKVEIMDTRNQITTIERGPLMARGTGEDAEQFQTITVTMPDQSTLSYEIRLSYNPNTPRPEEDTTQILVSKTNQEGMATRFEYIEDDVSTFNFLGAFATHAKQAFYPLTKIIHPTGARTEYTYEHYLEGMLGPAYPSYQYYRLTNRKDKIGETEYNIENWGYSSNDYTLFKADSQVYVTNGDGVTTEYYFKCVYLSNPQCVKVKDYERTYYTKVDGTEVDLSKTEYFASNYYEYTYPRKIVHHIYDETGNSIDTTENFEYDINGNQIKHWDAYAEGDTSNTEHLTTYAYDETYHYPVTIEYKQDANTTVKESYTPSSDHKTVLSKQVTMNNQLVSKENYTYGANSGKPQTVTAYRSTASGDAVTTGYTYADNALVTGETVNGAAKAYTYDSMGRVLTATDELGNITGYAYDKLGRQTQITNPDGTTSSVLYQLTDAAGNVVNKVTVTAENGHQTEYSYDGLGRVEKVRDLTMESDMAAYTYDSMGRIASIQDESGNRYTYTYDRLGRRTGQTVKSSSNQTLYQETRQYTDVYDANTSKVTMVKGSGSTAVKSAVYTDKYGNTVKEDAGDSNDLAAKRYAYDYKGTKTAEVFKTSAAAADANRYSYTTTGRANAGTQVVTKDYYNHSSTVQLNMQGQEQKSIDGNGNQVTTTYDGAGRVATVSRPMGSGTSMKSYSYDAKGQVTREQITSNKAGEAAQTRSVYYQYDSMGRVIRTWTDEEGATAYEYNSLGKVTRMTTGLTEEDPVGVSTRYEYDSRGRLVKQIDPSGQEETYTYDLRDNLIGMTDKNGAVTANTYDGMNRILTSAVSQNGESDSITYTYMTNGLTAKISGAQDSVSYSYNAKGLVTEEKEERSDTTFRKSYGYDAYDNRSSIAFVNSGSHSYSQRAAYNYIGQLVSVTDGISNRVAATYTYDGAGNVKTESLGNGNQTTYTYNSANLLSTVTNKQGSSVLSSYTYAYYLDGNQASVTEPGGRVQSFVYDGAGRLSREIDAQGTSSVTRSYAYDARGNRTGQMVSGAEQYSVSYIYDASSRLTEEVKTQGEVQIITDYSYDNNGNMIFKAFSEIGPAQGEGESYELTTGTDGTESYSYNLRNQMIGYSGKGKTAGYGYNALGMRSSKSVDGVTTNQVWSDGHILYEYGGVSARYTYGTKLVSISGTEEHYYLYNGHGNTVQLTNAAGAVAESYVYDAFGNQLGEENHMVYNPFRYNMQYTDEESQLIYLRNRYYDPSIGRFTQEDPAKDGLNWYVYCGNNPVTFVDPMGLGREPRKDQTVNYMGRMMTQIGAAKAKEYYDTMLSFTQTYVDSGRTFDDKYFSTVKEMNAKIDTVIAGDEEAIVYDMPMLTQPANQNYCWAYCRLMYQCYAEGKTEISDEEVAERINQMVQQEKKDSYSISGASWASRMNYAEKPSNKLLSNILKGNTLGQGGPAYLSYENLSERVGHEVIAYGYMRIEDTTYYMVNNPWGEAFSGQWKTYEQISSIYSGEPRVDYYLSVIYHAG